MEACFTILTEDLGVYHVFSKCFQQLVMVDQRKDWVNICTILLQQAEMGDNFIKYNSNPGEEKELKVEHISI